MRTPIGAEFTCEVEYDLKNSVILVLPDADDLKTDFSEAEPDDGLHNIRLKRSQNHSFHLSLMFDLLDLVE